MSLIIITAQCKNCKKHSLLWEKKNLPSPTLIKKWFSHFYGYGDWKIKETKIAQKILHKNSPLFTKG